MKNIIKLSSNEQKEKVIKDLIELMGLPFISSRLSIFTEMKKGCSFTINFDNNNCEIKTTLENATKANRYLKLKNQNIKTLFQTLADLGYQKGLIGEVLAHNFFGDGFRIAVLSDSFIGNIVQFVIDNPEKWQVSDVKGYLDNYSITENIVDDRMERGLELLIDDFGALNQKIIDFANRVGLDIRTTNYSIQQLLFNKSNDYSYLEKPFFEVAQVDLVGKTEVPNMYVFDLISIVIPSYNSESSILKTLYSIESQNVSKKTLALVHVIIVDDGSVVPVSQILKDYLSTFTFKIDVVRIEKNSGASLARNIGFDLSYGKYIFFLDSDLLLAKNFLHEALVRVQLIPNAVFVSFKKNIEENNVLCREELIKSGLDAPGSFDDLRVGRSFEQNMYKENSFDTEIVADSDYFKSLGCGRRIHNFDLSSMVIGHNICLRRSIVEDINMFSGKFVGWGLEDTYFGSKAIASGNFVIPIISTGVYHINHPPRSGSNEKKMNEFDINLKTYNYLLTKEQDHDFRDY